MRGIRFCLERKGPIRKGSREHKADHRSVSNPPELTGEKRAESKKETTKKKRDEPHEMEGPSRRTPL